MFLSLPRSAFVSDEIKKRNLSFSRDALAEFYRRIGYSPSRMLVELDKLAMYKNHLEKEGILPPTKERIQNANRLLKTDMYK